MTTMLRAPSPSSAEAVAVASSPFAGVPAPTPHHQPWPQQQPLASPVGGELQLAAAASILMNSSPERPSRGGAPPALAAERSSPGGGALQERSSDRPSGRALARNITARGSRNGRELLAAMAGLGPAATQLLLRLPKRGGGANTPTTNAGSPRVLSRADSGCASPTRDSAGSRASNGLRHSSSTVGAGGAGERERESPRHSLFQGFFFGQGGESSGAGGGGGGSTAGVCDDEGHCDASSIRRLIAEARRATRLMRREGSSRRKVLPGAPPHHHDVPPPSAEGAQAGGAAQQQHSPAPHHHHHHHRHLGSGHTSCSASRDASMDGSAAVHGAPPPAGSGSGGAAHPLNGSGGGLPCAKTGKGGLSATLLQGLLPGGGSSGGDAGCGLAAVATQSPRASQVGQPLSPSAARFFAGGASPQQQQQQSLGGALPHALVLRASAPGSPRPGSGASASLSPSRRGGGGADRPGPSSHSAGTSVWTTPSSTRPPSGLPPLEPAPQLQAQARQSTAGALVQLLAPQQQQQQQQQQRNSGSSQDGSGPESAPGNPHWLRSRGATPLAAARASSGALPSAAPTSSSAHSQAPSRGAPGQARGRGEEEEEEEEEDGSSSGASSHLTVEADLMDDEWARAARLTPTYTACAAAAAALAQPAPPLPQPPALLSPAPPPPPLDALNDGPSPARAARKLVPGDAGPALPAVTSLQALRRDRSVASSPGIAPARFGDPPPGGSSVAVAAAVQGNADAYGGGGHSGPLALDRLRMQQLQPQLRASAPLRMSHPQQPVGAAESQPPAPTAPLVVLAPPLVDNNSGKLAKSIPALHHSSNPPSGRAPTSSTPGHLEPVTLPHLASSSGGASGRLQLPPTLAQPPTAAGKAPPGAAGTALPPPQSPLRSPGATAAGGSLAALPRALDPLPSTWSPAPASPQPPAAARAAAEASPLRAGGTKANPLPSLTAGGEGARALAQGAGGGSGSGRGGDPKHPALPQCRIT